MICAGIDCGSRSVKIVIFDTESRKVAGSDNCDQGIHHEAIAFHLYKSLLERSGIHRESIRRIIATGYARHRIGFADTSITEITCHAAGVRFQHPRAMTIVEIGGQDSKRIRLDPNGSVRDFSMNDRCAAGTGRFLEMVASRLDTSLSEIGELTKDCSCPANISSMCVVFAETEIIGLLAEGTPPAEIAAGIQSAIATRVAAMEGNHLENPIVFTGGVARIPGMTHALEKALSRKVTIATDPHMTGALGAALLACWE